MISIIALVLLASPSCQIGPACSSFPVDAAEIADVTARCAKFKGTQRSEPCDTKGNVAVCRAGDIVMTFALSDEGQLAGFKNRCFSVGGTLEKPSQPSKKLKRVKLSLDPLPLSTTASDDCEASPQFTNAAITCGGDRPEVSLTVMPFDAELPQSPEAALPTVEGAVETRREESKSVVPKHGAIARGFVRALTIGGAKYLCQGSGHSAVDLKEALAICNDLKR